MKLVKQRYRNDCGVACVAMLAGIQWGIANILMKTRSYTTAQDINRALHKYGRELGARQRIKLKRTPLDNRFFHGLSLVKIHWEGKKQTHWVVCDGKRKAIYDPAYGVFKCTGKNVSWEEMMEIYTRGYATSYYPVYG